MCPFAEEREIGRGIDRDRWRERRETEERGKR
jgi:hypothetical protein